MIKLSTGARNGLLASAAFRALFNNSEIRIYSGPEPVSADSQIAAGNTLLVTINAEGNPLSFEGQAVDGVLQKRLDEIWNGVVANTGQAAFWRLVLPSDTGVSSNTAIRVQGNVKLVGGDINLSNLSLTQGVLQALDYFQFSLLES